jgi:PEP-CTERM motif-containing protein
MNQPRTNVIFSMLAVLALAMALGGTASASAITYSGSSGNLSASATFSLTGNTLTVTLTNTSSSDVQFPTDVLTAVWFDVAHTLTPVSASLNGSSVFYGSISNVGDGWGYYSGLAGGGQGKNDGITAVGFGIGSGHSNFSGAHHALQGDDYGLLSAGDNSTTGNAAVKNHGPLIKNSAQFVLTTGSGFNLSELGNSVVFQFGSSLTDTHFPGNQPTPEPGTLALLGSGMIGVAGVLRMKTRP